MYNLIFSERVSRDIERHIEFLANVSTTAAEQLERDFISKIESLSESPMSNPRLVISGRRQLISLVTSYSITISYIIYVLRIIII